MLELSSTSSTAELFDHDHAAGVAKQTYVLWAIDVPL